MPNRRRRRLSRALSAVAAVAVASPFAAVATAELVAGSQPTPEAHDFTRAALVTDLPNELLSALSSGLSQFGINLPPLPTGLSPSGAQPITGLGTTGLTSPGLGTTGLTSPGLTSPSLTDPALASPGLTTPGTTGLTTPGLTTPSTTGLTTPGLTEPSAAGLTSPATTGLTDVANPALTPVGTSPLTSNALTSPLGTGNPIGAPGEQPIAAPIGLDSGGQTYPILGDPSLSGLGATAPAKTGLVSDLSSAANSLGAGQAVDLLKGVLMPTIMGAVKSAAPAAAAAAPAAAAPAAALPAG
ncbi:MAG: hypothetical protein U0R77_05275 [Mycolicibacterium insubricum]